jgi:hypothetical protein
MDNEPNDHAAQPAEQPAEQPVKATPPFTTMAGAPVQQGTPTPGLSQAPGLRELPNSTVPGLPGGATVSHVAGPTQAPVDPIAAGLDIDYHPMSTAENRVITQTGTVGAGARPSTYVGQVAQAGAADHANVPAPSDPVTSGGPGAPVPEKPAA